MVIRTWHGRIKSVLAKAGIATRRINAGPAQATGRSGLNWWLRSATWMDVGEFDN